VRSQRSCRAGSKKYGRFYAGGKIAGVVSAVFRGGSGRRGNVYTPRERERERESVREREKSMRMIRDIA
jgi:hypothetical protein